MLHILDKNTGIYNWPGLEYTSRFIFWLEKQISATAGPGTNHRYTPRFIFWLRKQVPAISQASDTRFASYFG